LMFEFDMVLVPTSVSEIELAATSGFLSRHRWVFDSAITKSPALLVCPTRVLSEQLNSNIFTRQRFPVSFMLAPPILESQSARDMYELGYLMDLPDACGVSFLSFAQAVVAAKDIRISSQAQDQVQNSIKSRVVSKTALGNERQVDKMVSAPARTTPNVLATTPPSAAYSILSRHRQRKAQESLTEAKSVVSLAIPDFLKRFTRQNTVKM